VREVTKLRVVFEINISFANTECKTLTRIHWDRRFGRKTVPTHTTRGRLRTGCFLEDAGCVYLLCQLCHRTEHLFEFGGQVFDLLLERAGGSLLRVVLLVFRFRLFSFLFEIHSLMLFRGEAATDLALLLLFGITELEAKIDFEEKNGFLIEKRLLRW
jgi:hypothetical protein